MSARARCCSANDPRADAGTDRPPAGQAAARDDQLLLIFVGDRQFVDRDIVRSAAIARDEDRPAARQPDVDRITFGVDAVIQDCTHQSRLDRANVERVGKAFRLARCMGRRLGQIGDVDLAI